MQDGRTRKVAQRRGEDSFERFRSRHRAVLVVLEGRAVGAEYELARERLALGRGPGVDLALEDAALSKEHALLEYADGGFRVRDLGSTNGLFVNGERTQERALRHGDRIEAGEHRFQLVVEEREGAAPVHVLPED